VLTRSIIDLSVLPAPVAPTDEESRYEMARTLLFRAYASAGSVLALAAVVGAGTKWW
jgi:hypothetical protein